MPEQDFKISITGELDVSGTKKNLKEGIDNINKSGGKGSKVQILDAADLQEQGVKYIEAAKNIKEELLKMFRDGNNKVDIFEGKDMNGQANKYIATITQANQVVEKYVFNLRDVMAEEEQILAFVNTNSSNTNKGFGSIYSKQVSQLSKARAEYENVMKRFMDSSTGEWTGSDAIFTRLSNLKSIIDALSREDKLGFNTTNQMNGLKTVVDLLDKEVASYDKANAAQEKLNASQLKEISAIEESANAINNKYLLSSSSSQLMDANNIESVNSKLQEIADKILYIRGNIGKSGFNFDVEKNNLLALYDSLELAAKGYSRLESIQAKDKQTIDDQTYALSVYELTLRKIKNTTLNSSSASSLMNSPDINKITDGFAKFEVAYNRLRSLNSSGLLINKTDMQEIDLILKELTQDIKIAGTEMRRELTADTSEQNLKNKIAESRAELNLMIGDLERLGILDGKIRQGIINLGNELLNIKTPKDLNAFNSHLTVFKKNVQDTSAELKAAFQSEDVAQKLNLLSAQVTAFMNNNSRAAQLFKSDFEALKAGISNAQTQQDLVKLQNNFKLLQQQVNNAGKAGKTFGERIAAAAKKFLMWTGMTNVMMRLIRSVRQMITNVKELDTAMVLLRRVTNETDETYTRMFNNAIDKAKELKTSVSDLITSTAEFAKLGYSSEDSEVLAQAATVYKNVGQIDNIEDATKSITSTLAGFKMEASEVWDIVDKFDNIGNKFAISSSGIGDALMRSAASLSEANNTLDESIALATTANSVVQDPEKVGIFFANVKFYSKR